MTSLISWVGVDSRKISSLYLASDSRLSTDKNTWDYGSKLFASYRYPEILGYCGEVTAPTQILRQVMSAIDNDILFNSRDTPTTKTEKIVRFLKSSLEDYPLKTKFELLYGTRMLSGMDSEFHLQQITCSNSSVTYSECEILKTHSNLVAVLGSGTESVKNYVDRWKRSSDEPTSRGFFSALCDSIASGEDPKSGGAPQLVGLYRTLPAKSFGIIHHGKRYFNGVLLGNEINTTNVKWHNSLFEICDGDSLQRASNAQPQPRPKNL